MTALTYLMTTGNDEQQQGNARLRDRAVESWLHNQVATAYDALKADPFRAVTADQVRARLAAESLAASDYSQPPSAKEREWLDAPAVGGELL